MTNRILAISLEDHTLDPMSAEVWLTVQPEHLTPTTEVRGRLMGPGCPYASTVEIAYALWKRELQEPGTICGRVAIPEPSLWDVQSPFLYSGPVDLWQDGERVDRVTVKHGLRRFQIGSGGLRLNGKPLTLRGRLVEQLSEPQALQLHAGGCNLLLVRGDSEVWDLADRFGFLVLAEQEQPVHPSCLGWWRGDRAGIPGNELDLSDGVIRLGNIELGRLENPEEFPPH